MTTIAISGSDWVIDGAVTYRGRRPQGLLLNSRMANAVFDDLNPWTAPLWTYPDTGGWDPDRNTDELIAVLPDYRRHGLTAIAVNLQGGSPLGYYRSDERSVADLMARIRRHRPEATVEAVWAGLPSVETQPWDSGAFEADGALRAGFRDRADRLIRAADAAGMAVILGLFYFGQDERLADDTAVRAAIDHTCDWLRRAGFGNVVLEVNNECDIPRYEHPGLRLGKVHELIAYAAGRGYPVGTSVSGRTAPTAAIVEASDVILLHGNGLDEPAEITARVEETRALPGFRGQPIVFNEDDHFAFDRPRNNFMAAVEAGAGWGYFDPGDGAGGGMAHGNYIDGYQNPPVNWGLSTPRKRAFFDAVRQLTGDASA